MITLRTEPGGPLFECGPWHFSQLAKDTLEEIGVAPIDIVARHIHGDWGDVDEHSECMNFAAIANRRVVIGMYSISGYEFMTFTRLNQTPVISLMTMREEFDNHCIGRDLDE